jgi:hypothetical protein
MMKRLAVDIGETTGYALGQRGDKIAGGQMPGWTFIEALDASLGASRQSASRVQKHMPFYGVEVVILEDFVLYPPGVGPGPPPPWDRLETVRLIGAVEWICLVTGTELIEEGANIKDSAMCGGAELDFVRPLKENRHENDATMHLTYDWAMRVAGKRRMP